MNLYNAGFLNPDNANMALAALEMMEFDGKEKIIEHVKQGQTYQKIILDMQSQIDQMKIERGMFSTEPEQIPEQMQTMQPAM